MNARDRLVLEAVRNGWNLRPTTSLGHMFERMAREGHLLVLDDRGPGPGPIDDRRLP